MKETKKMPKDMKPKQPKSGTRKTSGVRIPYGRARPIGAKDSANSLAMLQSPGGKTVTQPEQGLSTSVVASVDVTQTPGGSKEVTGVQTEGGRTYRKRASFMLTSDTEVSRLCLFSPIKTVEEQRELIEQRLANRRGTYHGKDGSSSKLRAKVDTHQHHLAQAGVDGDLLNTSSQEIPSSELQETSDITIPAIKRTRVARKSTASIMGHSARDEFSKLLKLVKQLDLPEAAKNNLIKYLELNVSKLQAEWAHLTAHSHLGAEADKKANLGAGTERANTLMITSERAASVLAAEAYDVSVKTRFTKFLGTDVLKIIEHVVTVTAKDKENSITLINTISNIASPAWEDLPKTTDPQLVIEVLKAILENKPPRARFTL